MGKTVRFPSKFALQKCAKIDNKVTDRIGGLPDEILVIILSCLTMEEAARTSILSKRWRYLWTFFTGSLDFDASLTVYEMFLDIKSLEIERPRFINWVNQVLKSHQGLSIDGLKICFDMDYVNCNLELDSWIEFALKKQVRSLVLNLQPHKSSCARFCYTFPAHLVRNSSFNSLTVLHLICVDLTGEVLEWLLSYCTFLEVLKLMESHSILSLRVSGPSLKLKCLDISRCFSLNSLEISAPNLMSFSYSGQVIRVPFKHVPHLVEVSLHGSFSNHVLENIHCYSSYFKQLERLSLRVFDLEVIYDFPQNIPELSNLKYLELMARVCDDQSFLPCISLLDASPLLQEFTLKIDHNERYELLELKFLPPEFTKKFAFVWKSTKRFEYRCLKVVEFIGFVGLKTDFEFATYMLKNVKFLEKIIINTCHPYSLGIIKEESRLEDEIEIERKQIARGRAMELAAKAPSRIEFVIL